MAISKVKKVRREKNFLVDENPEKNSPSLTIRNISEFRKFASKGKLVIVECGNLFLPGCYKCFYFSDQKGILHKFFTTNSYQGEDVRDVSDAGIFDRGTLEITKDWLSTRKEMNPSLWYNVYKISYETAPWYVNEVVFPMKIPL